MNSEKITRVSLSFQELVFLLYYTQGLLRAKLKQHEEAVQSFVAAIDYKNYAKNISCNNELSKAELDTHQQILQAISNIVGDKLKSSNELANKAAIQALAKKYSQVIECFADLIIHQDKEHTLTIPDFITMFDIIIADNTDQIDNIRLGYGYYHKALSEVKLKQYNEALASLDATIRFLPSLCAAYVEKANIYNELHNFQEVISQYTNAIKLEPDNAELYFNRSIAWFELGDQQKANADFVQWQSLNARSG